MTVSRKLQHRFRNPSVPEPLASFVARMHKVPGWLEPVSAVYRAFIRTPEGRGYSRQRFDLETRSLLQGRFKGSTYFGNISLKRPGDDARDWPPVVVDRGELRWDRRRSLREQLFV